MRAHISCAIAMSGNVTGASQRKRNPCWAPACEYVAMPDGSSSEAPVVSPGPSVFQYSSAFRNGVLLMIARSALPAASTTSSIATAGASAIRSTSFFAMW